MQKGITQNANGHRQPWQSRQPRNQLPRLPIHQADGRLAVGRLAVGRLAVGRLAVGRLTVSFQGDAGNGCFLRTAPGQGRRIAESGPVALQKF